MCSELVLVGRLQAEHSVAHKGAARAYSGSVAAVQEVGADKRVDVTIEYLLHVAPFDLGAVVLNQLIGLHHVGANLAAEADFGLRGVELAHRRPALLEFLLVELRFQNLHGDLAILVLAALVLALHHDAAGQDA